MCEILLLPKPILLYSSPALPTLWPQSSLASVLSPPAWLGLRLQLPFFAVGYQKHVYGGGPFYFPAPSLSLTFTGWQTSLLCLFHSILLIPNFLQLISSSVFPCAHTSLYALILWAYVSCHGASTPCPPPLTVCIWTNSSCFHYILMRTSS